jgi:predicted Zn-dependent protease
MSDAFKARFASALEARDRGEFREAIRELESLLGEATGSKRASVLGVLGGIYLDDLGEIHAAERLFRECVGVSPQSELASLTLFHILMQLDRAEEALEEMKRFVSLRPSDEYSSIIEEWRSAGLLRGDEE